MKYLILFLLLCSCGTETGNPISEDDSGQALPGDGITYFTLTTADNICDKLIECYGEITDVSACIEKLKTIDGFDTALDLEDDYSNFNDIYLDEKNSVFTINSDYNQQCQSDINGLTCSDSEVINAYDSASPNDYSNVPNIIPVGSGSCQDVLSKASLL